MSISQALNVNQISGVMWKTVSESCNLACDYCYYSRCNGRPGKIDRINDEVLEKFIMEYMEMKRGAVPFAWQGGEPLLAGLDFFKMDFKAQNIDEPSKYLITPKEYGDFLCEVFDIWFNGGSPETSIRFFDNMLAVYLNKEAEGCIHRETCPKTVIFEQNGDAYPCDFYIHEDYRLGNIGHDSLASIVNHEKMDLFYEKKPQLPDACKSCEFLNLCHGGCPRNRQGDNSETEYFCESYRQIYTYAHDGMVEVAKNIRKRDLRILHERGYRFPRRNEPCLCGSREKFKKCCQPQLDNLKIH